MKTLREELEEILDMGDDVAKEMDITITGEPTVKVDYIKTILSRHPEEEPLAVVADMNGLNPEGIWPDEFPEKREIFVWAIQHPDKWGITVQGEVTTTHNIAKWMSAAKSKVIEEMVRQINKGEV